MDKILSILIPTLPEEKHFLVEMMFNLNAQISECNAKDIVEILTDDRPKPLPTGTKRNYLLEQAKGKYVWGIDTDDYIFTGSIGKVLIAAKKNPDVIGINGIMTTDGKNQHNWEIRLGHPYKAEIRDGKEYYLRPPNHITPVKREHAIKIKFPDKTVHEDYEWCMKLQESGLLQTQEIINENVYHYRVRSVKN